MPHRDSNLPLFTALAVAVGLHAALLPVGARMLDRSHTPVLQTVLEIRLGDLAESGRVGQEVAAAFEIINVGDLAARGVGWSVHLSKDRRLDDGDAVWFAGGDAAAPDRAGLAIEVGQRISVEQAWPVPEGFDGPWFVIAAAAAENASQVTAARSVWIDSLTPAVVEIASVNAPPAAVAGGSLLVGYALQNAADGGWAEGGWTDRVLLSGDATVSGDDVVLATRPRRRPLGPGQTQTIPPRDLRLPLGLTPGDYQLIITTQPPDASKTLQRSVPLRIDPATHPDLAIGEIKLLSGQDQLVVGQPTALRFEVLNRSPIPTADQLWGDRVYWSIDDTVSDDDLLLLSQPRGAYPGLLPGLGRYTSGPLAILIQPDRVLWSQMYLIVVADDENDLAEGDYENNNARALPITVKTPAEAQPPTKLELGRDDEPARVTVAWIAHDAFEDLLARRSRTHQPILQNRVDPTPSAPLEPDPKDTGQTADAPAEKLPTPQATPPAAQTAATSRDPLPGDAPGPLPPAPPATTDQPGQNQQTTPGVPAPPTPPTPPATPDNPTTVAESEAQPEAEKPTSAPRSDREADPTALVNAKSVRPGAVLVGPGLEVKTYRPNFSAASVFALPRNPKAVLTFDPDGTVLQADLLSSTGYDNIDGPLISSLYRWHATGDRLKQFTAPFQIEITILLTGRDESDNESNEKDNPK